MCSSSNASRLSLPYVTSLTPCSYPVMYVGSIPIKNSLRLVEFEDRNSIVREAIARVREGTKSRAPIGRSIPKIIKAFLGDSAVNIQMIGLFRCVM